MPVEYTTSTEDAARPVLRRLGVREVLDDAAGGLLDRRAALERHDQRGVVHGEPPGITVRDARDQREVRVEAVRGQHHELGLDVAITVTHDHAAGPREVEQQRQHRRPAGSVSVSGIEA